MEINNLNKQLAKVTKSTLSIKERGILNFWIYVEYEEGGGQGVGGITLDTYNKETKSREGTAYGCEMIRQCLKVFDVDDFSEMKGKHIWVLGEGEGFGFKPKGFQSLKVEGEQRTFLFDEVLNKFKDKQ